MQNARTTAGETALKQASRKAKRLVVMQDCHLAHNLNIDITDMTIGELNYLTSICDELGYLHVVMKGGIR